MQISPSTYLQRAPQRRRDVSTLCSFIMIGIEVASFILGVFPLVVSGLENYQKGLKPIRTYLKYKQELIALHAFVQAEHSKFLNSIDLLLQPLVPPIQLHHLITKAKIIDWKAPHLKSSLRRRLGPSEEAFYNALQVVEACLKELSSAIESKVSRDLHQIMFWGAYTFRMPLIDFTTASWGQRNARAQRQGFETRILICKTSSSPRRDSAMEESEGYQML